MNKIHAVAFSVTVLALSASAFAQESDAARQQRMDAAYANSHTTDMRVASNGVREDTREAGHAFHGAVRATGHAVHSGVRATGHAIHRGVRATGHAIHRGVDKVTGH